MIVLETFARPVVRLADTLDAGAKATTHVVGANSSSGSSSSSRNGNGDDNSATLAVEQCFLHGTLTLTPLCIWSFILVVSDCFWLSGLYLLLWQ